MHRPIRRRTAVPRLLLALCAALTGIAAAHEMHQHHEAPPPGAVTVRGLDTKLVDQDGRALNLQREVIGSRIVVVDFVYTTCTTVCPLASAIFADLQTQLGERVGRDVVLVTITVDPVRDTPQKLKAYAAKFGAGPGWSWMTGSPVAVNEVLKGLGAYTPDFTQHPQMMLVGDGRSGGWTRFSGLPDPKKLAEHVRRLDQQRSARAGG
ncbi:SCO family protein [uncultured Piscinibacter sp.]|uniref:SCO family protein n=1 Tax=uncultured Piscinibacter sp. TaxID=1131835 RepID=UPI002639D643|nr:SCO family protein [uncultured Piscinibacter sp.]